MALLFGYDYRRWLIIILCSYMVGLTLHKISIGVELLHLNINKQGSNVLTNFIIDIITLAIALIGLIGSIKEHLWLSLAFCILYVALLIKDFLHAYNHWYFIVGMIIKCSLFLIDISFVYDLYYNQSNFSSSSSKKSRK